MTLGIDYSLYYQRWHNGSYDELLQRKDFYRKLLSKELNDLPKNLNILDYGCGFGHLTFYLIDLFDYVIGVDASVEQIAVARKNNLPVQHVAIENFELWVEENTNKFDIIFLMDVLEHVPVEYQINFMRALNKILKSNGHIYIKVPNANSLLASRWRYNDWTHYNSFTECSLEFVCQNSGFQTFKYLKDETSITPDWVYFPRPTTLLFYFKKIIRLFWKLYLYSEIGRKGLIVPLGVNIFVKARKSSDS